MSEIVKGVLGAGWSLVAGWILPSAINVILFGLLVLPMLDDVAPFSAINAAGPEQRSLVLLVTAVVTGLLFSALRTPLYRVLEGYLAWPGRAQEWGHRRHLRRKHTLQWRIDVIRRRDELAGLLAVEATGALDARQEERLGRLRQDVDLAEMPRRDKRVSPWRLALLQERLARYPIDDDQIVPTTLGNAIRRLEEYAYDRFRLDSQALWYELEAVTPERLRNQLEMAQTGVDFFVSLLAGHLVVALVAALSVVSPAHPRVLLGWALGLVLLSAAWYRSAIHSTDNWMYVVSAVVNLGRKPLAQSLGLHLPETLEEERRMWELASKFVRVPYHQRAAALDVFRSEAREATDDLRH